MTIKLNDVYSVRTEMQALFTKQDKGDWAAGLIELTASPHWFFAVLDQYNYGNDIKDNRTHYFSINGGYKHDATSISFGFGKQRQGLFCVGGVCRVVPASYGYSISISTSF